MALNSTGTEKAEMYVWARAENNYNFQLAVLILRRFAHYEYIAIF